MPAGRASGAKEDLAAVPVRRGLPAVVVGRVVVVAAGLVGVAHLLVAGIRVIRGPGIGLVTVAGRRGRCALGAVAVTGIIGDRARRAVAAKTAVAGVAARRV